MTARAQRFARMPRGPFPRFVDVRSVPHTGLDLAIEASAAECAAIAAETELPGLRSLSARLVVLRRAGGRFEVTGTLEAEITERCVVSMELFDSRIEQPVELMFAPVVEAYTEGHGRDGDRRGRQGRERVAPPPAVPGSDDQVDPPDPIIDDTIDVGAAVVEFLTLARDPYPRKTGAEFQEVVVGEPEGSKPSAFAALERLKDPS